MITTRVGDDSIWEVMALGEVTVRAEEDVAKMFDSIFPLEKKLPTSYEDTQSRTIEEWRAKTERDLAGVILKRMPPSLVSSPRLKAKVPDIILTYVRGSNSEGVCEGLGIPMSIARQVLMAYNKIVEEMNYSELVRG